MKVSYQLLGLVQQVAPNGKIQGKLANAYNEMKRTGQWDTEEQEEAALCQMLAAALYAGLAYGNW